MVEKQRSRGGSRFSLNPRAAAKLEALPPLGYKPPPPLIGEKSIPDPILLLRAKNYSLAYKALSVKEWNSYVSFGIQAFDSPSKYLETRDTETTDEKNFCIARYYRLHLENNAQVDRHLMKVIVDVEATLKSSHPGFFARTLIEMDEYLLHLPSSDPMDIAEPDQPSDISSVELLQPVSRVTAVSVGENNQQHTTCASPSMEKSDATRKSALKKTVVFDKTSDSPTVLEGTPSVSASVSTHVSGTPSSPAKKVLKIPKAVTNSIRVEVRWAPKDFQALKTSTAQMYIRLAPILSAFNSPHSWVVEWQTDQLATSQILDPATLTKFLSIRVIPSIKQQCFFFSFRVNATGSQFTQVAQSSELHGSKKGEHISFDPSFIPTNQGEITNVDGTPS